MAAAGPLAAAGLVAGLGVGALKIGESFDTAFDHIIERTGATGDKLAGLKGSFENVFSTAIGANFENTADAIGLINIRTGLAGGALEELATKFIELSKITKTDVNADVTEATSLFGLFGIAADQQSGKLDVLFKAAQLAGVGFGEFTSTMQGVIPTAQALGFSFDQAAALTSNLTKLGLPASKVMMALGTEFSKAAKAGKEPTEVIAQMVKEIQKAPNATVATTLAIKDFGLNARSAATFVASARSGTMEFADTLAQITNGKGGIIDTTNATADFGEKFGVLKNKALTALEPIASKVFDLANILMDKVPAAIAFLQEKFTLGVNIIKLVWFDLTDGFRNDTRQVGDNIDTMTGVFFRWGQMAGQVWDRVQPLVTGLIDKLSPIVHDITDYVRDHMTQVWQIAGFAIGMAVNPAITLAVGLTILYAKFQSVRDVVDGAADRFRELAAIVGPFLGKAFDYVREQLTNFAQFFIDRWDRIKEAVGNIVKGIAVVIAIPIVAVLGVWKHFHEEIQNIASTAWAIIQDVVSTALHILGDLFDVVIDIFSGHWGDAWHKLVDIVKSVGGLLWRTVGHLLSMVWELFKKLPGDILNALGDLGSHLQPWAMKALHWFAGLPGKILGALGDLAGKLIGFFADSFSSLAAGLPHAFGFVVGFFVGLPFRILDLIGKADTWLVKKGWEIITGLVKGLVDKLPDILNFIYHLPYNLTMAAKDAAIWLFEKGKDIVVGAAKGLWDNLPQIIDFVTSLPLKLVEAAAGAQQWLLGLGHDILVGLYNGVVEKLGDIGDIIGKIKDGFIDGLKSAFDFGSPSKLMMVRGRWIAEGLADGITANAHLVDGALDSLTRGTAGATRPGGTQHAAPRGGARALPNPLGVPGTSPVGGGGPDKLDKTNALLEQLVGHAKKGGLLANGEKPEGCYTDAQVQGQTKTIRKMRTLSSTRQR